MDFSVDPFPIFLDCKYALSPSRLFHVDLSEMGVTSDPLKFQLDFCSGRRGVQWDSVVSVIWIDTINIAIQQVVYFFNR